jgi:hypothetical protein
MGGQPAPGIRESARAIFERIITEHKPEPLPMEMQLELKNIIEAAERRT